MRPLIEEGHLYIAQPPLFGVKVNQRTKKERIIYAWNQAEVNEICASLTEKYEIQRFKGLGEMNFEELRESTMNKDTRRLIKVTVDDAAATIAGSIITTFLGSLTAGTLSTTSLTGSSTTSVI